MGSSELSSWALTDTMPHGASEDDFFDKLDESLAALKLYQPDVLVLALGFDIYQNDPQAKVSVTSEGFCRLSSHIRQLGLPTLVVQEGGYDLESLRDGDLPTTVNYKDAYAAAASSAFGKSHSNAIFGKTGLS